MREGGDGAVLCTDRPFRRDRAGTRPRCGLIPRPAPKRWRRSTPACANRWSSRPRTCAQSPRPRSTSESKAVELPQGQTVTVRDVPVGCSGPLRTGRAGRLSLERADVRDPGPGRRGRADRPRLAAGSRRQASTRWSSLPPSSAGSRRSTRWAAPRRSSPSPTGTETIAPVDVIAGPGNAWVREAKRAVSGTVGIDSLAGPSELMLVAGARHRSRVGGARPLRPGRARGREPAGRRRGRGGACSRLSRPRPRRPRPSRPASATRHWR